MKSIFSKIKKMFGNKNTLFFVFFMALIITPTFASSSSGITELDTWAQNLLDLFTSTWVKALLLIALIVEAIALVLAGQQGGGGQMLKKFAPWIVGTVILLSATSITSFFLDDLDFKISYLPTEETVTETIQLA